MKMVFIQIWAGQNWCWWFPSWTVRKDGKACSFYCQFLCQSLDGGSFGISGSWEGLGASQEPSPLLPTWPYCSERCYPCLKASRVVPEWGINSIMPVWQNTWQYSQSWDCWETFTICSKENTSKAPRERLRQSFVSGKYFVYDRSYRSGWAKLGLLLQCSEDRMCLASRTSCWLVFHSCIPKSIWKDTNSKGVNDVGERMVRLTSDFLPFAKDGNNFQDLLQVVEKPTTFTNLRAKKSVMSDWVKSA